MNFLVIFQCRSQTFLNFFSNGVWRHYPDAFSMRKEQLFHLKIGVDINLYYHTS